MANVKIGINGFGRIGRIAFRIASERPEVEVVGINDLLDVEHLAYLLKYDSVHGQFKGSIEVKNGNLVVNGNEIRVTAERNPEDLKWDGEEISKKVQEVLVRLPEKQQLVFELRYYQDLSFKEISKLTGTSTGALKANYHHAKIKMEENLIGLLNLP